MAKAPAAKQDDEDEGTGSEDRTRRNQPRLDDEAVLAILRAYRDDAADYADGTLAPDRERAFAYYEGVVLQDNGEAEDEQPGRSNTVVREVADIIHTMLPGIIRIFAGGERVVDYEPNSKEDEPFADQATEYVSYLLNADGNNWFATLYDAVHDALLKKLGVIKWWYDESESVEEFDYTGLTLLQFMQLASDPEIEVLEQSTQEQPDASVVSADDDAKQPAPAPAAPPPGGGPGAEAAGQPPPAPSSPQLAPTQAPPGEPGAAPAMPTGMPQPAPGAPPLAFGAGVPLPIIDCTVRRTRIRRVLRVEAVPPEEFLIAREARVVAKSRYVCHRTNPMVGELVARGYDFDTVARYAALDTEDGTSTKTDEAQQRNKGLKTGTPDTTQDISTWRVPHDEHWVRVDTDGDGIAELHRICTVGPECNDICYDEQEADIPFAILSAVRLPHAAIGYAISDQTIDLQDIKTSVLRSILDSLAQSIFPRTAVVENAVTMDDVLNNEVGAVIRMQAPGMVQPLAEPFIGPQALQVMNYLDEMRAQRTGISRQSQGLDANVLQSTTKTAVSASVEAQQDRVELIARTFAELGVKDVFRGVLRYVIRHQDKPRVVRLRNQWVEVDPRFWDAEMDVSVNVGLGRGTNEQRMAFLGMIGAKQEQVLQMLGPSNPIVSIGQLRETYAEMLRIAGFKNPDRFFKTVTPEQEKQLQEQMAQNKPPDPNQLLAETENNKTKQKQQSDTAQRTFDREKALLDDDFRRDQLDADILLRAAEIAAKYGASVDVAEIRAALERDRNAMQLRHQMAMQDRQNEADAGIASQQGQVQRDVASTRANQQIRTGLMREALRAPPMTLPGGNGAAGPAQAQRTMGGIPADGGPA